MRAAELRRALAARICPAEAGAPTGDRATEADLVACYRLLLGRRPDASGLRAYGSHVGPHGVPVDDLVKMFVSSAEFRARLTTTLGWSTAAPVAVDLASGYRIFVLEDDSSVSATIRQARAYEPHVVSHLGQVLRPGMVFVDVGASIGFYTVLAGREVGPEGQVIACEPGPQNHSVLHLNIVANDLGDRVEVFPVAMSDRAGVLLYSASGGNGAVGPYNGDPLSLATHALVPAATLDTVLCGQERVDVIKIDVEGAEGLVLAGGQDTLERHRPALYFEFTPSTLATISGVDPLALLAGLEARGYRFEVLPTTGPPQPADAAGVMAAFDRQAEGHIDVCGRVV